MRGGLLPANLKTTSVLRRIHFCNTLRYIKAPGFEGQVSAFKLVDGSEPIVGEGVSGRAMTLLPGDLFLGTPGHRESPRWVVGDIPRGGLVPGKIYWLLADSGLVGDLVAGTPHAKTFLGQARYLGAVAS